MILINKPCADKKSALAEAFKILRLRKLDVLEVKIKHSDGKRKPFTFLVSKDLNYIDLND